MALNPRLLLPAAALLLLAARPGAAGGDQRPHQEVGTIVNGATITGDTTWTAAGNPYQVRGTIRLLSGTFTIAEGVQIVVEISGSFGYCQPNGLFMLIDGGRLRIAGSPSRRVLIEMSPSVVNPCDHNDIGFNFGYRGESNLSNVDFLQVGVTGGGGNSSLLAIDNARFRGQGLSYERVRLTNSVVTSWPGTAAVVGGTTWSCPAT